MGWVAHILTRGGTFRAGLYHDVDVDHEGDEGKQDDYKDDISDHANYADVD